MRKTLTALIGAAATVTMITGAGTAAAWASHPAASSRPAAVSHAATSVTALPGPCPPRCRPPGAGWPPTGRSTPAASRHRPQKQRHLHIPRRQLPVKQKATHEPGQHFSKVTCAGVVQPQRGTYKLQPRYGRVTAACSSH